LNALFQHIAEAVVVCFFNIHYDAIGKPTNNVESSLCNVKHKMRVDGLIT